jgi:hypothetical protein
MAAVAGVAAEAPEAMEELAVAGVRWARTKRRCRCRWSKLVPS